MKKKNMHLTRTFTGASHKYNIHYFTNARAHHHHHCPLRDSNPRQLASSSNVFSFTLRLATDHTSNATAGTCSFQGHSELPLSCWRRHLLQPLILGRYSEDTTWRTCSSGSYGAPAFQICLQYPRRPPKGFARILFSGIKTSIIFFTLQSTLCNMWQIVSQPSHDFST